MSCIQPLAIPADCVYTYDGSFDGFLSCVYESVYTHTLPAGIFTEDNAPLTLLDTLPVSMDREKARRVQASIPAKISPRAMELVSTVFLSCLTGKELALLTFLLQGYREGGGLLTKLGDPVMAPLLSAERRLWGEVENLLGFVRFSDTRKFLVSTITPKNFVLPFLAEHFMLRYRTEQFILFDKTHSAALLYEKGRGRIVQMDSVTLPPANETEALYQSLWKRFYDSIAIKGRENPRCRMTNMPKRYWESMLEVRNSL